MIVTGLECISKSRIKVYIDEEFAFILYPQDIRKYKLKLEEEIEYNLFLVIIEETVLRRAKNKALNLLANSEQTEKMIRDKLKNSFYTEDVIDKAIEFLKSYNYIDDSRYARMYIETYKNSKSIIILKRELYMKGVQGDIIDSLLEEIPVIEEDNLRVGLYKKLAHIDKPTEKELNRIINYFMRRGYRYQHIVKIIEEYDEN